MSTAEERGRMAAAILDFEARRSRDGHLQIYDLPEGDGGGAYEVAGINERHHPEEASQLAALIRAGRHDEAEKLAHDYIATYTDFVAGWTGVPALESYLRDCAFNRGPRGAGRILQRALGVKEDGIVGPATRAALAAREADPPALLKDLRTAREQYERDVAKRDETDKFWKGLVKRWDKALDVARGFLPARAAAFSATEAVVAGALAATGRGGGARGGGSGVGTPDDRGHYAIPVPADAPVLLRALRIGSTGDLVRAWQSFLSGQGFDGGEIDGHFGDKTAAATQAFQAASGLDADGIAGRQTLLRAMALGFELIEEPAADATGSNFPPRPDFPPLVGTAARQAVFGAFDYAPDPQPGNRERIRILGNWEKDNIVTVPIPQLRLTRIPNPPSGMRFHRLAAAQLQALWADWEAAGLLDRILSFDGSYVPRFIRGSTTTLSNHAFGTAFDINARWNPLGARPPLVGETGSVRELVPHAGRRGLYWGGHFKNRPDGMHFEVAFLTKP